MPRGRLNRRFVVAALVVTLILANVPYGWVVLYPFKLFATWLHEASHGLAMLTTGAGIDRLEIFQDTSGIIYPYHAVTSSASAAIACAGYMGTSLFGAGILVLGRTERGARWVLAGFGLAMSAVALGVGNRFGAAALVVEGTLVVAFARWARARIALIVVDLLGLQSCINAILDLRVVFAPMLVGGQPHAASDADIAASAVGGSATLWALLWLVWSLGISWLALRLALAPLTEHR